MSLQDNMERRWAERSLYDNNYDLLRMVAALMVVFYHSYAAIGEFSDEPFMGYFWEWGKPGLSANNLGVIGVHIFFVISGYLVTASYMREHENYLERRLRRIMPGLIGGILFCAFIIGPLATVLPLAEYFQLRDLYWFLAYVFLFPVETIFTIGDVFATHHVPALNVPLWTIPWEMICYMLLPFTIFSIKLRGWQYVMFAVLAGLLIVWRIDHPSFEGGVVNCLYFLVGSLVYRYRHIVPLAPRYAAIALIATLVCYALGTYDYISVFTFSYIIIYLACFDNNFSDFRELVKGDYSYGVYIYSWPVQQMLIHMNGGAVSPHYLFIFSLAITLILAMLSWHYIEKPFVQKRA